LTPTRASAFGPKPLRSHGVGLATPETGCVLEIQRFADGARLYPHAHALVPEGVFVASAPGQSARFIRQEPPHDADVVLIVTRIEARLTRVLQRWRAARTVHADQDEAADEPLLLTCAQAAPSELLRVQGQPEPKSRRATSPKKPLCARSPGGLELHAQVTVAAHDRQGLERLCRYLSRPPIPQDRLFCRDDGKLVLSLKRTWKGGIKAVVFEPHALIARLAALVPAPYRHLRRFHGVFAPHHHLRSAIVPTPAVASAVPAAPKRPKRMTWADLLMRVWAVDALKCPWCGGRMQIISAIHAPDALTAILAAVHTDKGGTRATGPPANTAPHETIAA